MANTNRLRNIAIVGAGGNSGRYMTEELLKNGQFKVTAISRGDSKSVLPRGVDVKTVDYDSAASLTEALQGQDCLVITLGTRSPKETQIKLIDAAGAAGVQWILPNEWSPDTTSEALCRDVAAFAPKPRYRNYIKHLNKSSYIAVSCGHWYEWSLSAASNYGFDFANRRVTFFDNGKSLINTSTWPQVGRAVAKLLSLPIRAENGKNGPCLDDLRNKQVYISSFLVSQKDMFESTLRVTGTKVEDWKIDYESVEERYATATADLENGDMSGMVRQMYSRMFFPDDLANFEKRKGTMNKVLDLPEEDIDEATARTIEHVQEFAQGRP